eukprot:scaffold75799_cov48-Phaeocystis_antarctica.AAC.1
MRPSPRYRSTSRCCGAPSDESDTTSTRTPTMSPSVSRPFTSGSQGAASSARNVTSPAGTCSSPVTLVANRVSPSYRTRISSSPWFG